MTDETTKVWATSEIRAQFCDDTYNHDMGGPDLTPQMGPIFDAWLAAHDERTRRIEGQLYGLFHRQDRAALRAVQKYAENLVAPSVLGVPKLHPNQGELYGRELLRILAEFHV